MINLFYFFLFLSSFPFRLPLLSSDGPFPPSFLLTLPPLLPTSVRSFYSSYSLDFSSFVSGCLVFMEKGLGDDTVRRV